VLDGGQGHAHEEGALDALSFEEVVEEGDNLNGLAKAPTLWESWKREGEGEGERVGESGGSERVQGKGREGRERKREKERKRERERLTFRLR
jgi:hypothetical protein